MDTKQKKSPRVGRIEEPVVIEELSAMIRYASERGLDPAGQLLVPLYQAVQEKKIDGAAIGTYAKLVALVNNGHTGLTVEFDGVNGRTLLDTEYRYKTKARPVVMLGVTFLVLAVLSGALDLWFEDFVGPNEAWLVWLSNIHHFLLSKMSPLLWGAIGACVFLMKRLSDKAADRCFDSHKWQGWGTRIFLGAILGAIAVIIYDKNAFTRLDLSANALAFISGMGVRVIYGALEKTVDLLVEKLNLSEPREIAPKAASPVVVSEQPS